MKNLIKRAHFALYILLTCVIFTSCGYGRVEIDEKENPFIVGTIEYHSETHSRYKHKTWGDAGFSDIFAGTKPTVVAPNGMWQVGDTISFNALNAR